MGGNDFRLSADDLSRFTGTYEFNPELRATIAVAEGVLALQEGNGPKRVLIPQTEKTFLFRDNGDAIEFVRDAKGTALEFVIHAAAGDRRARRSDRGVERK